MRLRNTLLLLLVLAALGAYVWWVELPQEKRQTEEKKLVAVDKAAVTKITLQYPDREIVLEKPAEHWRIVKPVEVDADDNAASNLINAVATAEVTRTLDDVGDKLASYGLAKPEAIVTLTNKDGTSLPPLKVGKTTQIGFSSYVQKGDDPKVYITAAALQNGMKKEVKDLRDKTVITFEDPEVQKLELWRPDSTIDIERQEGEHWQITTPGSFRGDDAEMRSLLANVRGIRATDFPSDDPAADLATYGLAAPRLKATVWLGKDRAQKTLIFGETKDKDGKKKVYAKRGEAPTIYEIAEYTLKNVDKELVTLRDKTVVPFDKEKAAKLVVTRKDGAGFTLAKGADGWHVEGGGEGTERGPTITRFIDDIAALKGSEIAAEGSVDATKFGLNAPDITVAISDASGAALGTLLASIGTGGPNAGADATSYVAPGALNVVYGVKPFVYTRFDKKASDFRAQPATPVPSGAGVAKPAAPGAIVGGMPGGDDGAGDDQGLGAEDDLGDEDAGDEP